jgi:hypothetical protein
VSSGIITVTGIDLKPEKELHLIQIAPFSGIMKAFLLSYL